MPENGWIYQQPFGDSILDDYLSVRGLEQISLAVTGKVWSGKELYGLVKAGNMEAEEVWRRFGADVAAGLLPVLEELSAGFCCFWADRLQKVFPGLEKNWKESARKERFGFR